MAAIDPDELEGLLGHGKEKMINLAMMSSETDQSHTSMAPDDQSASSNLNIQRPVYNQHTLHTEYTQIPETRHTTHKIRDYFKQKCSRKGIPKCIMGLLPCICLLKDYQWKKWIIKDIIAGLSVGVVHIPQGLGFALITSVPPVYGLYSAIFPPLFYFLFGTSRHISFGTMAIISLVVGEAVEREAAGYLQKLTQESHDYGTNEILQFQNKTVFNETIDYNPLSEEMESFKISIAVSVTALVGIIQILMSVFHLGTIATFMSMSFIGGFMTGAAFHILTNQVPLLLGIKIPRQSGMFKLIFMWYYIFANIKNTNIASVIISIISIIILYIVKEIINVKFKSRLKVPIPAELIVVIIGILVSHFCKLNHVYSVNIVGKVDRGIPPPALPSMYNFQNYITDAFIAAVLSFSISISMAKIFARKHGYKLDYNQEALAYGMSNGLGSLFHSFAGAQAPPRSFIQESTGGKSQLASIVQCVVVLVVCIAISPVFRSLPITILASIITVAIIPLFKQFKDLHGYWRLNRYDLLIWMVTWLSVVVLDLAYGLALGIAFSFVTVVIETHRKRGHVMGQCQSTDLFLPVDKYQSIKENPEIKIFSYPAPIIFANAESFRNDLYTQTVDPTKLPQFKDKRSGMRTSGSTASVLTSISVNVNGDVITDDDVIENGGDTKKEVNGVTEKQVNGYSSNGNAATEKQVSSYSSNGKAANHNGATSKSVISKTLDKICQSEEGVIENNNDGIFHTIVVDCACVSYTDIMGLSILRQIRSEMETAGISLVLASCTPELLSKLGRNGFPEKAVYPSVIDAVIDAKLKRLGTKF